MIQHTGSQLIGISFNGSHRRFIRRVCPKMGADERSLDLQVPSHFRRQIELNINWEYLPLLKEVANQSQVIGPHH